jgi:hypothetical protein
MELSVFLFSLTLGWVGVQGNAIISKNLVGGKRLDVMLPGRHVTAIFGFCDIRKFTDT